MFYKENVGRRADRKKLKMSTDVLKQVGEVTKQ